MKKKEQWKDFFAVEQVTLSDHALRETKRLARLEYRADVVRRRQSFCGFLLKQLRFLAWKIWFFQGMVLAAMCALFLQMFRECEDAYLERNLPSFLCICSGVIMLSAFPLIRQAVRCKMFETEQAAYFSGTGRIAAQLLFIGGGDICMLFILAVLAARFDLSGNVLFVSLVIPFLTAETSALMVWMRSGAAHFESVEIICCMAPPCIMAWLIRDHSVWISERMLLGWIAVAGICLLLTGFQYREIFLQNNMEKLLQS